VEQTRYQLSLFDLEGWRLATGPTPGVVPFAGRSIPAFRPELPP